MLRSIRVFLVSAVFVSGGLLEASDVKVVQEKLDRIRVSLTFQDADIKSVFRALEARGKDADASGEGVSFIIPANLESDKRVTLDLQNIPLSAAMRYVALMAHVKYRVTKFGVFVVAPGDNEVASETREFRVPSGWIKKQIKTHKLEDSILGKPQALNQKTMKEVLELNGVDFSAEGANVL